MKPEVKVSIKKVSAPEAPAEVEKKKRRCKPGALALREIRQYQNSTGLLISKLPFSRCVREIALEIKEGFHFQKGVFDALQHCIEHDLVHLVGHANLLATHAGRQTLTLEDLKLVQRVKN